MTRKNIFDLLEEKYDIKYEMEKITQLFFFLHFLLILILIHIIRQVVQ